MSLQNGNQTPAPPPPPPPMTTHQVASGIARWAISRGLLGALPPGVDDQYLAPTNPISFNLDAEQILRHKEIQTISFNEFSNTIFIYTKRKVTGKDLKSLPVSVGRKGISYPQGQLDIVGKDLSSPQGAVYALHNVAGLGAAYTCGSSISPGNDRSAGTLGALVRLADGLIYGLTNNHVSALCSHVAPNTPILAPGVLDVGPNAIAPFTLGFHSHILEMKIGSLGNVNIADNLDAALFRINNVLTVSSMQGNAYDTPTNVIDPVEGMKVEKVGRTTRHTVGTIVGRELRPIGVSYQAPGYGFSGVIYFANVFTVHGHHSEFSLGGDSGSLVVATDQNGRPIGAVGLVFAGGPDSSAPGGQRSSILPIRPILTALNANLVGGHNV